MATPGGRIELRLLGSLEVLRNGEPIAVSGPKPRALLACLALHLGEAVSTDRLIEDLWSGSPPRSAAHALQVYVSKLRTVLDSEKTGLITARPPGYELALDPGAVDIHVFERLVKDGRRALHEGNPSSGSASLREALSLWRGPALADFVYEPFAQTDIARLEDLRTAARESLVDAELELGHHGDLLSEIEALAAENPFAERSRAQLMLALYRAGRQADALAAYRKARETLVEELGVEPSTALRELEQAILRQDASLELPAAIAWPVEERRKTVTVLFADLVGSSALAEELDPEAWRRLQERLFAAMRAPLELHEGTVEKFVGDAVMAVFGVPTAHEDDALRAVRAAVAMRTGLAALNAEPEQEQRPELALRIGVNTGEVFTGGPAGGPLVSGSVVNLAKRLEEAALPGEILLGTGTLALVRHAITTEQLRARRGGEEAAVPAFLLVEVIEDAPAIARYLRAPLVGREEEFATLRNAFEEVRSEESCRLVTILGEPGIGKTRLANELVASLGEEATVLVGRCVSYGEGATYLPLAEMVGDVNLDTALAGEEEGQIVAERVRELIGVGDGAGSSEEGFWAVRHLCEALARERPLVLVFEDLHWGEPTLLDLIEHLQQRTQGAILLLCVARLELLERRPRWAKTALLLEPLPEEDSQMLVTSLPGGAELLREDRTRILETASGNPLFVEQLFAYVQDEGAEGTAPIPPTISALLTARLDALPEAQRVVLERASVEGKIFQRESLVELTPERIRPTIGEHLTALVRKGLVQPERPTREAETLRFHHDLVRDAAYESLPKRTRAELHERLADWLESREAAPDEILGYHLEQAYRYRNELTVTSGHDSLGRRAGGHLATAGLRAYHRGDETAAANLLERAVALFTAEEPVRLRLLPDLAEALFGTGEFERARETVEEAVQAARTSGDEPLEFRALMLELALRTEVDPTPRMDEYRQLAERAIPVLQEAGDERALAESWLVMWESHWYLGETTQAVGPAELAYEHASRAGDAKLQAEALQCLIRPAMFGPWHVQDALDRCEEVRKMGRGHPWVEMAAFEAKGYLSALEGDFDVARSLLERAMTIARDVGAAFAFIPQLVARAAEIELIAGDAAAAEALWRGEFERARASGRKEPRWPLSWAVALADALCEQGRYQEAAALMAERDLARLPDDRFLTSRIACVQGRILAGHEDLRGGERALREGVAIAQDTDVPNLQGDALMDLAAILRLAERPADAATAANRALDAYERKGNIVSARKARALLDELRPSPTSAPTS